MTDPKDRVSKQDLDAIRGAIIDAKARANGPLSPLPLPPSGRVSEAQWYAFMAGWLAALGKWLKHTTLGKNAWKRLRLTFNRDARTSKRGTMWVFVYFSLVAGHSKATAGTKTTVSTNSDGSSVKTVTEDDGKKTVTVTAPDGSTAVRTTQPDGSSEVDVKTATLDVKCSEGVCTGRNQTQELSWLDYATMKAVGDVGHTAFIETVAFEDVDMTEDELKALLNDTMFIGPAFPEPSMGTKLLQSANLVQQATSEITANAAEQIASAMSAESSSIPWNGLGVGLFVTAVLAWVMRHRIRGVFSRDTLRSAVQLVSRSRATHEPTAVVAAVTFNLESLCDAKERFCATFVKDIETKGETHGANLALYEFGGQQFTVIVLPTRYSGVKVFVVLESFPNQSIRFYNLPFDDIVSVGFTIGACTTCPLFVPNSSAGIAFRYFVIVDKTRIIASGASQFDRTTRANASRFL